MKRPLSGLKAWLVQRLTAVFMLAFIVFVLVHFVRHPPHSYEAWRDWITQPWVSITAILFIAALLTHACVGLRDVTLDYVNPLAARITVLSLIALALLAAGAWAIWLLWPGHA